MSPSAATREAQEQEQALSSSLAAANEQLKAQSDTFLKRSKLRSRLGNHAGALKDAQCAVTLSPESAECLIRLSQALIHCGQPGQAFDAYKQASSFADAKEGQLSSDLAILHRQLLPFDELPNEILAAIFLVLYADWENLPSPFQIPHVCQRWRRIANSTPALWRDTRILRVRDKVPTGVSLFYCLPIKKPYSLARRTDFPLRWSCSRQDGNHIELLRLCQELSCQSLCHIDVEIWDWYEGSDWAGDTVLNLAREACATLTSIALVHTRPDQRQHFDPVGIVRSSGCSTASLELVLLCPKLVDVELSVGELLEVGEDPLPKAALEAEPTPSFRRLRLDCLGGFAAATGPRALRLLLARSAQLTSLTLSNVLDVNWGEWPDADDQPFAIQLIAACANTLVELTIDGFVDILSAAFQAGTTVFPHLQRLRHVPRQASAWDAAPQGLVLPELKDAEGLIELIQSLPVVPADITLRLDGFSDCDRIRDWLLGLPYDQSPHALTILVPFSEMIPLKKIIKALTPSTAGKVVCPALKSLTIRGIVMCVPERTGNLLTLDPLPIPRPIWRDDWQALAGVSFLARMEEERRRVSQGLQPRKAVSSSPSDPSHFSEGAPSSDGGDSAVVWAPCEALSSIEIEGCHVNSEAWEQLKASPCRVSATPSPDGMVKLRWEKVKGQKRKRGG